jgi:predicted metal-dependent hydrolase
LKRTAPVSPVVPGGMQIFQRMYTRLGVQGRPPYFEVQFHPYANLTHTMRLREQVAHVRLSDILRGASPAVLEAIAAVLLARLYRRRTPRDLLALYQRYAHAPATRSRLRTVRRNRARHLQGGDAGTHHDLGPVFEKLNDQYFQGALPRPRLVWSTREWLRQLGCFDPALRQIVINRRLDRADIPQYAVAYVMYHEMLHLKHPARLAHCRLESHSASFRAEEKQFESYGLAMKFLRGLR